MALSSIKSFPIIEIKIKERIREDAGNISALKESMNLYGLLNPITINNSNYLIAGFRRLQAAKELGWTSIECRVTSDLSEFERIQIEADENITRKDFTIEELVKIEELKNYARSRGLKRLYLWLMRILKRVKLYLSTSGK